MHPTWRHVERMAIMPVLLFVLLLGAYAVGRSNVEVRDGAGYVTTSANVAYAIAATLLGLILLRVVPLPGSLRHQIRWYGLAAIAVHSLGLLAGLYARFWWYDDALHMILAGGAALLLVRFAQAIGIFPPAESTPGRAMVLVVTAALACAAVWEIFEYSVGKLQGTRLQATLDDTMLDMIDAVFGGIFAAAWISRHPRPDHEGAAWPNARAALLRTTLVLGVAGALALAGCTTPEGGDPESSVTPAPTANPPTVPAASEECSTFTVSATPDEGPAAIPRLLEAQFTNCGEEPIRLAHACLRGMDIRLIVLYNSTDPANATPPGVGPQASYLVDNPIANDPLACATAPPHVREVPAGETLSYAVAWSGLVDDPRCSPVDCPKPLAPGRYLLAATAENADTREAYIATQWLALEG